MTTCTPNADDAFGPAVGQGCRDDFDFTLLFEQCFFQLAPCALLLLLVPLRTSQLHAQSAKVLRNGMQVFKLLAILALAATQLALLVLWCLTPMYRTRASIPAAAVSFLASLALMYLSSIEHTRSVRPSTLINWYILFSLLFDIPQARTLWLRAGPRSLPALFTAGIASKLVVFYLEACNKRRSLFPRYQVFAPESLVSLYNRTMVWWINPLFWKGYKTMLSIEGLYSVDDGLKSEHVAESFQKHWTKRNTSSKHSLLLTILWTIRWSFISMIIPRVCTSALKLSQALFINRVTSLLAQPRDSSSENLGWSLTVAAALIYVGMALSTALYERQIDRMTTKVRAVIVTAVYSKSLHLSSEKLADSAGLTLITTDVQRICMCMRSILDLLVTPLEIGIAIFLLERKVGLACIAPAAFTIFIGVASFFSSNIAVPIQKKWLQGISARVAYTSAVLNCPKGFKMLGLTNYFTECIQRLRVQELVTYATYCKFTCWRNILSNFPMSLAPPICLMVFTLINGMQALDPNTAFTALSLVVLMTTPIDEIIHTIPMLFTVLASVERVQNFLLLNDEENFAVAADHSENAPTKSDRVAQELAKLQPHSDGEELVRLINGSVVLGSDLKVILRDVNLSLARDKLTLVIGPVGCGKSTLLKTMVGEIGLARGRREVDHSVTAFAFCSQDPWLPNTTVKNLVCGHTMYDANWYRKVVHACALTADINDFPEGDSTLVGTKGVSLSGGQRQRLSLARAVYSRKKMMIADDVLSGLDANTSKHVFNQVFGTSGLCKASGTTVVLATHARHYLEQSEYIVALSPNGVIQEQGTFAELNVVGTYVYGLKHGTVPASEDEQPIESTHVASSNGTSASQKLLESQMDLSRRTGDMAVYSYYIKSIGWKLSVTFFLCALVGIIGQMFPTVWVRLWSEAAISDGPQHPLGFWIGVYFLIAIIGILFNGVEIWVVLVTAVPKSSAQLHRQILDTAMRAKYTFFTSTDSGVTLNRFSSDMGLLEGALPGAVLQTCGGLFQAMGAAALIATGSNYAAAAVPFILFALYCVQRFYLRTSRQLRSLELEAQAPLITHCSETLAGVTTIRAFGWQHQARGTLLEHLDASQRPFYLLLCIQRWLTLVLGLVTAAFAVIVIGMATNIHSTSSAAAVGLSLLNVLSFTSALTYVVNAWTTLETSLGAVARCKSFEASTPTEDKSAERDSPTPGWPTKGCVEFSNLTASYTSDDKEVLKSVSLSIDAGEKVGICGRSGSGKSSLLLTLFRLLDSSTGSIVIDGVDLAHIPRQTVRERFCALPQETISFPGSLRDNLDPLRTSSEEDAILALQKTGLYDVILPRGGLEADMQSLGLSQGQMQLFAISRALLRKSKILVLDEMTSSVDAVTEETMLRLVQEEFADSTVLAIAHRLKTIVNFDKIVVMDSGRIVEIGSPGELLAKKDGLFKALWERSGEH